MNGLSLLENINIDLNNMNKIPTLLNTIKDQPSFQDMIGGMRNMFREHLWRHLSLNSEELINLDSPKLRELGGNIKMLTKVIGIYFICFLQLITYIIIFC
jgi:hypothetical protein